MPEKGEQQSVKRSWVDVGLTQYLFFFFVSMLGGDWGYLTAAERVSMNHTLKKKRILSFLIIQYMRRWTQ